MTIVLDLLDAVESVVSAAGLLDKDSGAVTVQSEILPVFKDVNTLTVKIFPGEMDIQAKSSSVNDFTIEINVFPCHRTEDDDNRRHLVKTQQDIMELFAGQTIPAIEAIPASIQLVKSTRAYVNNPDDGQVSVAPVQLQYIGRLVRP